MPLPEPTAIPTSLVTVLIVAVTTLAGVITYLWRHYQGKLDKLEQFHNEIDKGIYQERLNWAAERGRFEQVREEWATAQERFEARLRGEFEGKHRTVVEDYAKQVSQVIEASRQREDAIRREYTENMELIAGKAESGQSKVALVLEKFYDRYVSPRPRGGGKG